MSKKTKKPKTKSKQELGKIIALTKKINLNYNILLSENVKNIETRWGIGDDLIKLWEFIPYKGRRAYAKKHFPLIHYRQIQRFIILAQKVPIDQYPVLKLLPFTQLLALKFFCKESNVAEFLMDNQIELGFEDEDDSSIRIFREEVKSLLDKEEDRKKAARASSKAEPATDREDIEEDDIKTGSDDDPAEQPLKSPSPKKIPRQFKDWIKMEIDRREKSKIPLSEKQMQFLIEVGEQIKDILARFNPKQLPKKKKIRRVVGDFEITRKKRVEN